MAVHSVGTYYDPILFATVAPKGIEGMLNDQEFKNIQPFYFATKDDEQIKQAYSTDFGKLTYQIPSGVFKPRFYENLQTFIAIANKYAVPITIRGQGHSTGGQTLCENSVVIDLADFPKDIVFLKTPEGKDAVTVHSSATWKEVIDAALPRDLTVPVLTDYLGLSVGGTLSFGGLGGSSYLSGSQSDNVLECTVLKFNGEIVKCSTKHDPELFQAVLCSMGQMGIILQVTLQLIKSKENVSRFLLSYRDVEHFLKDQYNLYSKGKLDHLKGYLQKQNDDWIYTIEAAVFHDTMPETSFMELFECLSPEKIETKENTYVDFINETGQFIEALSKADKWDLPHPWYNVLLPEDQVINHLNKVLKSPYLTGSEPIILYPLNTELLQNPLFIRPCGTTIYLLGVLFNCSFVGDPSIDLTGVLDCNKNLYADALERGGCRYPVDATPFTLLDWEQHFGKMWSSFCLMKTRYDPHSIRALS